MMKCIYLLLLSLCFFHQKVEAKSHWYEPALEKLLQEGMRKHTDTYSPKEFISVLGYRHAQTVFSAVEKGYIHPYLIERDDLFEKMLRGSLSKYEEKKLREILTKEAKYPSSRCSIEPGSELRIVDIKEDSTEVMVFHKTHGGFNHSCSRGLYVIGSTDRYMKYLLDNFMETLSSLWNKVGHTSTKKKEKISFEDAQLIAFEPVFRANCTLSNGKISILKKGKVQTWVQVFRSSSHSRDIINESRKCPNRGIVLIPTLWLDFLRLGGGFWGDQEALPVPSTEIILDKYYTVYEHTDVNIAGDFEFKDLKDFFVEKIRIGGKTVSIEPKEIQNNIVLDIGDSCRMEEFHPDKASFGFFKVARIDAEARQVYVNYVASPGRSPGDCPTAQLLIPMARFDTNWFFRSIEANEN